MAWRGGAAGVPDWIPPTSPPAHQVPARAAFCVARQRTQSSKGDRCAAAEHPGESKASLNFGSVRLRHEPVAPAGGICGRTRPLNTVAANDVLAGAHSAETAAEKA